MVFEKISCSHAHMAHGTLRRVDSFVEVVESIDEQVKSIIVFRHSLSR